MKQRSWITASTAIALIALSLVGSPAQAAKIAGSACTQVGSTKTVSAVTYTCIKAGKKAKWDAGTKVIAAPAPQPSASATPTPAPSSTPAPSTTADAALTDYTKVASLAKANVFAAIGTSKSNIQLTTEYEPGIQDSVKALAQENVQNALTALTPWLGGKTKFSVLFIASPKWGREHAIAYDPTNQTLIDDMNRTLADDGPWGHRTVPCRGLGGFAVGYLKNPLLVIDAGPCSWSDPNEEANGIDVSTHVLPHEMMHAAQTNTMGTQNVACAAPQWLVEGQPQVFGADIGAMNGVSRTAQLRKAWFNWMAAPKADALKALETDTSTQEQYRIGALGMEYLIARSGFAKSMAVLAEAGKLANYGCPNGAAGVAVFKTAFKNVYGQSLDDFYTEAQKYIDWSWANR